MKQANNDLSFLSIFQADLKVQAPSVPDRQKNLAAQNIESIGNEVYDSECLKLINEYFYGVRIFPGQDPTHGTSLNNVLP